ncbi:hypothetical protein BS78_08G081000 [Paspalum vaginatum]|nr:hypothetical protein BS78_08G081000 [Paspalum vaginatum]
MAARARLLLLVAAAAAASTRASYSKVQGRQRLQAARRCWHLVLVGLYMRAGAGGCGSPGIGRRGRRCQCVRSAHGGVHRSISRSGWAALILLAHSRRG